MVLSAAVCSEPIRVVSQTVGTDELLLAVAAPAQVVALSHLAREPEFSAVAAEAAAFPRINQGDAETILRHHPTLVLVADYSRADLVSQVERTGVQVLRFDRYASLDDAFYNLRLLARHLDKGAPSRAEEVIMQVRVRLGALRSRLEGVRPKRVIAPSTYGVIGGAHTTFQDLCDHAVAENLADTLGGLSGHAPPPNEQMITWPIEYLVVAGDTLDEALSAYRTLPPYRFMPALRERRAVRLEHYMLSSVSHHRVDGYEMLARGLHPEAFGDEEASP